MLFRSFQRHASLRRNQPELLVTVMPWPVHPTGFLGTRGDEDSYKIERSLRFNSADSAYLSRTPASTTNQKTFTWSFWWKTTKFGTRQAVIECGGASNLDFEPFQKLSTDKIQIAQWTSSFDFQLVTTQVFRDPTAWYHVVVAFDTTKSTASNRIKLYINGSQITSFDTSNYPSLNSNLYISSSSYPMYIGGRNTTDRDYADGYLTEINFIDGQALTPSSFGETDAITGRWKAKAFTGTYGTNGFYLKFADNSGTTATTLGRDSSGNTNNWTPYNFSVTAGAGNDSLLDSPTNSGTSGNYCTLNPLWTGTGGVLSDGNLQYAYNTANWATSTSIIGVSSGKWYWEIVITSGNTSIIGISNGNANVQTVNYYTGQDTNGYGYYSSDGKKYYNGSGSTYGSSYTTNDVIGVALNMDAGTVTMYKNNVSQGVMASGLTGTWFPTMSVYSTAGIINFGQRPFAYTAPTGFKALCTTNLPTPTIQKPSTAMDVVTYTGNNSTQTISGLGFSPDLIWIKDRSRLASHVVIDSIRGVNRALDTASSNSDTAYSFTQMSSINSNGFSLTSNTTSDPYYVNINSDTFVAWAWDAGSTTSTNNSGTITSTVSVNPTAGFSIVSYTGNGTIGASIGHSLGVSPKLIIIKNRTSSATNWPVYHASQGATNVPYLETAAAYYSRIGNFNNTSPSSSVFYVGGSGQLDYSNTNYSGSSYIAYCFSEIEGYSKFGSYTGNGSADGPFVWCGFRPRWVLIKNTTTAGYSWEIFDTSRDTYNASGLRLFAESSSSEVDSRPYIDSLSNGIKIRSTGIGINGNGSTYIFAAFAESPFKYARAR